MFPSTLDANSSQDCIYLFTYISSRTLPRVETLHIVPISRFGQVIFVRKECAVLEAVLIQGLGEQCFRAMAGNVYSVRNKKWCTYSSRPRADSGIVSFMNKFSMAVLETEASTGLDINHCGINLIPLEVPAWLYATISAPSLKYIQRSKRFLLSNLRMFWIMGRGLLSLTTSVTSRMCTISYWPTSSAGGSVNMSHFPSVTFEGSHSTDGACARLMSNPSSWTVEGRLSARSKSHILRP